MSKLVNAVDANTTDKFIIGELPADSHTVSIVTMEELYDFFKDPYLKDSNINGCDVACANDIDAYYAYGIVGAKGRDSTLDSLKSVGINWYRQKNKAISENHIISLNGINVFGGPLYYICRFNDDLYQFNWYYTNGRNIGMSYNPLYWSCRVSGDVCVAVVKKGTLV